MNNPYIIGFKTGTIKQLMRLDRVVIERILAKLLWLARNVAVVHHEVLTGQLAGRFKLRVSDYRVVYAFEHDERLIVVEAIGHRREVYDD